MCVGSWVGNGAWPLFSFKFLGGEPSPPNGDLGKQRSPALLSGYGDNPKAADSFETGMKTEWQPSYILADGSSIHLFFVVQLSCSLRHSSLPRFLLPKIRRQV